MLFASSAQTPTMDELLREVQRGIAAAKSAKEADIAQFVSNQWNEACDELIHAFTRWGQLDVAPGELPPSCFDVCGLDLSPEVVHC